MADLDEQVSTLSGDPVEDRKRLKEERKKLKEERKAQKKEAKKKARELADQEDEIEEAEGGIGPVLLVTLIMVVVWLAVLGILIKLDVGGFGSGVLRPILKDVPVVNQILPSEQIINPNGTVSSVDETSGYRTIEEAVEQVKRLELELENSQTLRKQNEDQIAELKKEIERLKTFEANQVAFEKIKNEFYNEVIYADNGPGAEEYVKYYESMDPATAQKLYQEVVKKQETDAEITNYANAYAQMKPKQAAAIFEAMTDDLDLAAKILKAMGADERGAILGAMNSEVAARLTKIMDPES